MERLHEFMILRKVVTINLQFNDDENCWEEESGALKLIALADHANSEQKQS